MDNQKPKIFLCYARLREGEQVNGRLGDQVIGLNSSLKVIGLSGNAARGASAFGVIGNWEKRKVRSEK